MTAIELYSQLEKVPLGSFLDYFKKATSSAFRLELLPSYKVDQEIEALKQFANGAKSPSPGFNQDWLLLVGELVARKVKVQRVRLIDEPVSDYIKFEIGWGYSNNVRVGEEIKVISRDSFDLLAEPAPITKDFWLFDDEICVFLEYDFTGKFLGLNRLSGEAVNLYKQIKQTAVKLSLDIRETKYWK